MYSALRAIDSLKVLLAPFVPFSAERVHRALGYEHPLFGAQHLVTYVERERTHEALVYDATQATGHWAPSALTPGQRLEPPKLLYKKLEETAVGVELHA
jgi:methionyl-tRNA synthetase